MKLAKRAPLLAMGVPVCSYLIRSTNSCSFFCISEIPVILPVVLGTVIGVVFVALIVLVIIFIVKKARKQRAQRPSSTEAETNARAHYSGVFPKRDMFWQNRGESMTARGDDRLGGEDTRRMIAISKAMNRVPNIVSTNVGNSAMAQRDKLKLTYEIMWFPNTRDQGIERTLRRTVYTSAWLLQYYRTHFLTDERKKEPRT